MTRQPSIKLTGRVGTAHCKLATIPPDTSSGPLDKFTSEVAVQYAASSRGQLVVDFADLDIREGILEQLGYSSQ